MYKINASKPQFIEFNHTYIDYNFAISRKPSHNQNTEFKGKTINLEIHNTIQME